MTTRDYICKTLEKLDNSSLAFSTFALGRATDIASTLLFVEKYGVSHEANPIARFSMDKLGTIPGLATVELAGIALVVLWYEIHRRNSSGVENILPYVCGGASLAMGIRNLSYMF